MRPERATDETGNHLESLERLGWDEQWQQAFAPYAAKGFGAGRIVAEHRGRYRAACAAGDIEAAVAGSLQVRAIMRSDLPAVGDFVALRMPGGDGPALVQAVLPRRSAFVRKAAGPVTDDQVVAANITTAFIVDSLEAGFNAGRLDRYLALAHASGARPVIVLNKADRASGAARDIEAARARGVPVHRVSALTGDGMDELDPYLGAGCTIALLGPSGAGKSTLTNRLVGHDLQKTGDVRASDHRGRHTTTSRQMLAGRGGSLLIDTPGMRELQLWLANDGVESTFQDIEDLAARCHYRDCRHDAEPGCAVRAAVERGDLDSERVRNHAKMLRELHRSEALDDIRVRRARKLTLKRQMRKKKNGRAMG
jgi:ribosome biogenesis GTPase